MAENEIKFVGDSASLEKAQERIVAGQDKVTKSIERTAKVSNEAAKEDARLKREAERLTKSLETSEERRARRQDELNKMHQRGHIDAKTHARAIKELGEESDEASHGMGVLGDRGKSAMAGIAAGAMGAIAGTVSLTAALAALNREYEKAIQNGEKVRQAAVGFQNSMESLRMNFNPDDSVGWGDLDKEVLELAKRQGVSVNSVAEVLGGAFSAKGDRSNKWAFQAAEDALTMIKQPAEASVLASASGDIAKFGESQDSQALQGFLKQLQLAARITTVEGMTNATPAISAGKELGMTAERAAEYWAAIGNQMTDTTGQTSASATVNFFNNLGDKFKLTSEQEKDKELMRQFTEYHALPKDEGRINFLRQNEALREAFILNNPGEAKAGPALRSLLRNDEKWQKEISEVESVVPSLAPENDAANRQFFQDSARQVQAVHTPAGEIAENNRQSDTNIEQRRLGKASVAGHLGSMRDIMTKTYEELDLKGPDWIWESAEFMNRALGEKFGSENPEDVLLKTFDAMKEVVREEDRAFFLDQRKLLEKEREGVIRTRRKVRGEVPDERPQLKEGIDFQDDHSRPGMEGLPPRNESGAYEGTIREVSSTVSPQSLQQAVAAAVQPMVSKFDQLINNGQRNHLQEMQAMNQQTAAINRNRPRKESPLARHNRGNRNGYA